MKNNYKNLRGLIIGCGSIGERHLHNIKKIGIKDIGILDINKIRVNNLSKKYSVKKFYDLDSALSFKPDFSIICTLPESHIPIASSCINSHSHVFIEKPLSSNLKGVIPMLNKAKTKKLKVAVGYNLRFDKGLCLLKQKIHEKKIGKPLLISSQFGHHIKFWRPSKDYRKHYILNKGGGIILDGSHEYDYIKWLFNTQVTSVFCQSNKLTNIKTRTESIASILLKLKNGITANLNIDYVRPDYERKCNIIGEKGELEWQFDLKRSAWSNYNQKINSKITLRSISNLPSIHFNNKINVNDMYTNEMVNFLDSIIGHKKLQVDGWEGLKTLQVGLAALESASKNKIVKL